MTSGNDLSSDRASTGIRGLDQILGGGLPRSRTFLVKGAPGSGKTTLAMQFLLEGRARGERGVYVALSETEEEIQDIARSHGWSLDGITIIELQSAEESLKAESQYTFFHPSEIELSDTTRTILEAVERVDPQRIVFDSLSEMRLLARDSLRYRRQLLSLKEFFTQRGCTVLLLDIDRQGSNGEQFRLETLVHGFLGLRQVAPVYGDARRKLRIGKLRGVRFAEGEHDFRLETGGLQVFPRLLVSEHVKPETPPAPLSSGLPELDQMLGGGLDRGTSTMFLGPAGIGKSSLATRFVQSAIDNGERAAVFLFDEHLRNWWKRTDGLGFDLGAAVDVGRLSIRPIDPAQLSPGELAEMIRAAVVDDDVSVVLIDSLNGYRFAMPGEDALTLHLHELFTFLDQRGVVTLLTEAQQGFLGNAVRDSLNLSYLADTVVLMRYFEAFGLVRKALSVVKKRTGSHESSIRELRVGADGLAVGEELHEFQGALTGELVYTGNERPLFEAADG